jgi:catechol 2,3-dioxygenase-like lactoylglutathione lyase family enzyme
LFRWRDALHRECANVVLGAYWKSQLMTAQLNHTIVYSADRGKSARFLAEILGLPAPVRFGPFEGVALDNGVSLDFAAADGPIHPQHYAFLISEADFDAVFDRIRARGLQYWADPRRSRPGEINHNDGGRGVYFPDPDGHYLEVITRPYGSDST